jgi:hypothetical protein
MSQNIQGERIQGNLNVTSVTGSFSGSLTGTSSYASQALSSSYSTTASYISGIITSASYASTASYITTAQTASYVLNAVSASYSTTASYAATASYFSGTVTSASYASTASYWSGSAVSASFASTASYVLNSISSSFATTASYALSASWAPSSGGGGTPAGSDTNIQFNNAGVFGADSSLKYISGTRSLEQGRNVTGSGAYSHAEGENTVTIGDSSHAEGYFVTSSGGHSHAEGYKTNTGTYGYHSSYINSGVIKLDSIYGNVTAEFVSSEIIINDSDYDYNYGTERYPANSIVWDGTNTIITLNLAGSTVTTSQAIIGIYGYLNPLGANYIIGKYQHAEGNTAAAIGDRSHAEGDFTYAYGNGSHAEGGFNTSFGAGSHAEGNVTLAYGNYSHTEGDGASTYGYNSHAEGQNTMTIGYASHAEGKGAAAGSYGYVASVTAGVITLDSVYGDVTADFATTYVILETTPYLISSASFSAGSTIVNLVDTSVSPGGVTVYVYGSAMPTNAGEIIGNNSHAEGNGTIAMGNFSHANGVGTIAIGEGSFTAGMGTVASGYGSVVIGTFNNFDAKKYSLIVGNGVDGDNRSNLLYAQGTNVDISGSLNVTAGITGSLLGSATSASYVNGSKIKNNVVTYTSFGGTPLSASVTFVAAFPTTNYTVTITGEDARIFTIQNKTTTGFEINTNSNTALTGNTYWQSISYGEYNG